MTEYWHAAAPQRSQPGLGLIYPHDEHGDDRYFSAFQIMAVGWPFMLLVPVAMLGIALSPKKNGVGLRWEEDDPRHLFKAAAILSALWTPFLLSTVGSSALSWLISAGYVASQG